METNESFNGTTGKTSLYFCFVIVSSFLLLGLHNSTMYPTYTGRSSTSPTVPDQYFHNALNEVVSSLRLQNETSGNRALHGAQSQLTDNSGFHHDSVLSRCSTMFSHQSSASSLFSANSTQSSSTTGTSTSLYFDYKSPQEDETYNDNNSNRQCPLFINIEDAVPRNFEDLYTADLLQDSTNLIGGRPKFTQRPIIDWELNDLRSLFFISSLQPDWNNTLPIIITPHYTSQISTFLRKQTSPRAFRFVLLPLTASDEEIVHALSTSDIYIEQQFDTEYLVNTAKSVMKFARTRHNTLNRNHQGINILTKAEWRNLIENYLLNLGCEAQCRYEYKLACHSLKDKMKIQRAKDMERAEHNADTASMKSSGSKKSLLKRALLQSSQPLAAIKEVGTSQIKHHTQESRTLSGEQKRWIWIQIQADIYQRLGLNWQPDKV